jgi:hypothetical protein
MSRRTPDTLDFCGGIEIQYERHDAGSRGVDRIGDVAPGENVRRDEQRPLAGAGHGVRIERPVQRVARIRFQESLLMFVDPQMSADELRARLQRLPRLSPGVAMFGKRQRADAVAGDGKDGVTDGGEDRRQGGLAEAGG